MVAKYVVPPTGKDTVLIKCYRCGTLYMPENANYSVPGRKTYFEPCPFCNAECNDWANTVPLWKYNLIKFFRGGFRRERPDAGGTKD